MAQNWVQAEDYPDIIDAKVDESVEILENVNFFENSLVDDEDYLEEKIIINQNVPVSSFLYAESSVDVLRNYFEV